MGDTGLEQPTFSNWKVAISPEGDAKSDARGARPAILTDAEPITADAFPVPLDDDLRRLLDAWPTLTACDRRAVSDLVSRLGKHSVNHSIVGQSSNGRPISEN